MILLLELLLSATIVSAIPTMIMMAVASRNISGHQLNAMVAFAAGALLADATHHSSFHSADSILVAIVFSFSMDLLLANHASSPNGILALTGDAIHNFLDGLAIASSMVDPKRGFKTVLAITLHEIPHQLADLAILLQCGFGVSDILKSQMVTALACFVGVFVGRKGAEVHQDTLSAFTSGGFIYLSLCSLLPSIKASKDGSCVIIIGCFILGILIISCT